MAKKRTGSKAARKRLGKKGIAAALLAARSAAAQRNGILAVGIGHKRCGGDPNFGYGRRPRLSLKFFVRYKRDGPLQHNDRVPKRIRFQQGRQRLSLPTDVIAVGIVAHHQPVSPPLTADTAKGPIGSCGFLTVASDGSRFLITAGHLLTNFAAGVVVQSGASLSDNNVVQPRVVNIGTVFGQASPRDADGHILDVGLVKLYPTGALQLPPDPWLSITGVLGEDQVGQLLDQSEKHLPFTAYGAKGESSGYVDSILNWGTYLPSMDPPSYYGPVLVHVVTTAGILEEGDSGAPVVTNDKQLIGIHVVGLKNGGGMGFAVLGATALQVASDQVSGGLKPLVM